jgi:aminopeptidase
MKKSLQKKYAKLLVKSGVNLQKGQELTIYASIEIADFVRLVVEEAYKAKASKVSVEWNDETISKLGIKYRSVESLGEVREWEKAKLQDRVDHLPARLYIESDDPDGMKDVDQAKVAKSRQLRYPILKPYIDKLNNKEQWCIAGVPGKAWAKKIFPELSTSKAVEKLWEAILMTSRVDENNPVKNWEVHNKELQDRCNYLNDLGIKELHYTSSNGTDLRVGLLKESMWCGGDEATNTKKKVVFNPNIPTEEVFTSPDKTKTNGIVYSAKPLSYQGQLIEDFWVKFENGKAIDVGARKGEELLRKMISMDEGAAFLGECALIAYDSPINNTGILFFNTLYDENASCHLALGTGFTNCFKGYENMTDEEIYAKGINESMIHVDFMIGSKDLSIEAVTYDNKTVQIFKDGSWAF